MRHSREALPSSIPKVTPKGALALIVGYPLLIVANALRTSHPRQSVRLCGVVVGMNGGARSLYNRRLHAAAAVSEALILGELGDERSLDLNDQVIKAHSESSDEDLRIHVAWATVNKGWNLVSNGRGLEAVDLYREFSGSLPHREPFLHPMAQGLVNLAIALDELGMQAEELEVYDRLARDLWGADDDSTASLLAWAFINKGIILASLTRLEQSIGMYDVVIERWSSLPVSGTPRTIQEALAAALRYRAEADGALGHYESAISSVDQVVDKYLYARDEGVEEEVAWALLLKAAALETLGQRGEAHKTYDALVERYKHSSGVQVRAAVHSALRRREGLET